MHGDGLRVQELQDQQVVQEASKKRCGKSSKKGVLVTTRCPLTCGVCGDKVCENKKSNKFCNKNKNKRKCELNANFAANKCAKTCGAC